VPKFFNSDLAELTHQLLLSPRRLRVEQLRGIETLLGIVEEDRAYPYDFVCYHITKYRKRGEPTTASSIPGKALIVDLVTMAEVCSRKTNLTTAEIGESLLSHREVAKELNVSTKTVRRWRDRGLLGLRAVCADGVNRLVFWRTTVERFVRQHAALVARGAAFKQLSGAERDRIVDRARELLASRRLKLHAAAKIIAEESGRAVETVRYTLRRFDATAGVRPLFAAAGEAAFDEQALAMWKCREAGDSVAVIAQAMECSAADVEQGLRTIQVQRWAQTPLECIYNELFDAPNADVLILYAPEPASAEAPAARIPKDLPPYLQSLYLTPLLTREQEQDLFRRYNYVKYKTAKSLQTIDTADVTAEQCETIAALMGRIEELRQRIIRANLRLVVSIAKKHVGWSDNFFEVVSDGNVSLMRAAEKFDFARGTKFSTYATWAVMKNYARSIPEQHYKTSRYITGQELVLDQAPDRRPEENHAADREHVREAIDVGLKELTEREREVVRHHFGLANKEQQPITLEQLGRRWGITKERVRQIEQKALSRLREILSPSLADAL